MLSGSRTCCKTKKKFSAKSIKWKVCRLRLTTNTWRSATRQTKWYKEWSMRIKKWHGSKALNSSKRSPTWSYLSMRRGHSSRGNKKWSNLKMKWWGGTLNSSSNVKIRYKLLKTQLRRREKGSSVGSRRRSFSAGLRRNSKKTWGMNCTSRRARWRLLPVRRQRLRRKCSRSSSCRKLRSFKWELRLSGRWKKNGLKFSSRRSWCRSLLRTSA